MELTLDAHGILMPALTMEYIRRLAARLVESLRETVQRAQIVFRKVVNTRDATRQIACVIRMEIDGLHTLVFEGTGALPHHAAESAFRQAIRIVFAPQLRAS